MKAAVCLLAVCIGLTPLAASGERPVDIPTRARGAAQVVLATVVDVHASFATTPEGDRIILSRVLLQVDETMKGSSATQLDLELEGGTVGDLTLTVSDLPSLKAGERAVFFLRRQPSGVFLPHLRGLGILKLDESGQVPGSSLTIDTIRSFVRDAGR